MCYVAVCSQCRRGQVNTILMPGDLCGGCFKLKWAHVLNKPSGGNPDGTDDQRARPVSLPEPQLPDLREGGTTDGRPECIHIAAKMLDTFPLNLKNYKPALYARLTRANDLCRKAGGELRSRQVVAMIIEQWEREA